jgi:dienelactone hydrolase
MRRLVAAALVPIVGALVAAAVLALTAPSPTAARSAPRPGARTSRTERLARAASVPDLAKQPSEAGKARVGTALFKVPAPTVPGGVLDTQIWYPATAAPTRLVPDRSGGPYPLIVFSQGFDLPVSAYTGLLRHWAGAGFVVAAPTYPYTAPPGPLDEADIVNHPAELRLVISALIGAARDPRSELAGMVNPAEVGLAGHSDGGDVSLAVADNTCCRDPAVKALAVLSGAELASFGGTYFTGPQVPLLVVQGNRDPVNVPACSAQIYDEARGSRFYLDLLGADHEEPYVSKEAHVPGEAHVPQDEHVPQGAPSAAERYQSLVARATTDFFQAELASNKGAVAALERAGNVPGLASLVVGGEAPVDGGWCPGSPA